MNIAEIFRMLFRHKAFLCKNQPADQMKSGRNPIVFLLMIDFEGNDVCTAKRGIECGSNAVQVRYSCSFTYHMMRGWRYAAMLSRQRSCFTGGLNCCSAFRGLIGGWYKYPISVHCRNWWQPCNYCGSKAALWAIKKIVTAARIAPINQRGQIVSARVSSIMVR